MQKLIYFCLLFIIVSVFMSAQDLRTQKLNENLSVANQQYEQGNYNPAITSYLEIINNYHEIMPDSVLLEAYTHISYSFYLTGNFNRAIYYYSHLANMYTSVFDTVSLIKTYRKIGVSYRHLKKYQKAESFYAKGLDLARKINSKSGEADIDISFGNLFREKGDYSTARQYFEKSIKIGKELKDTLNLAINYVNFAELALLSDDYDSALYYLDLSLKFQQFVDHKFLDSAIFKLYAKIWQKKGNYDLAEQFLNKAINIETASYSPKRLITSYKLMAALFQDQKKYEQANTYLQKYTSLNDSILSEENKRNTALYESLQELQDVESENKLNKEKLNKYKTIYIAIGSGVFLLLLIIGLLVKNRMKDKVYTTKLIKKNKQIISQNEEIAQQNEEITQQNEELKVHKESLQDIIDSRTEELKFALGNAEESNRLKASFLKNISHEVRTPMNAIVGFAQLLEYRTDDPNYKYIQIIDKNVHELLNLIDGIIELSRIQSQQTKVVEQNFYVKDLFNSLYLRTVKLREKFNKTHVDIVFDEITNPDEQIKTDKEKVFILLMQLIENALKYTEEGSLELHFSKSDDTVVFTVKDTGIGIEDEKINQIFESFVKIESKEKLYRGTGLGLAIVKNMIDILKGNIKVESKKGDGTSFRISIPILS